MNKKIVSLIFAGCFFTVVVGAEKKSAVSYPSAEELREVEDQFKNDLNEILSSDCEPIFDTTRKSEQQEISQEESSEPVPVKNDLEIVQQVKVEKKTAEQYITNIKEIDAEINSIAEQKKMALALLEDKANQEKQTKSKEIEETTVQRFTERNAEFLDRKKELKNSAIQAININLDREKTRINSSYDQMTKNRKITKETILEELSHMVFVDPCEIQVGDFYREAMPQYFSLVINCPKLNLNAYKEWIEIELHDETKALYIEHNKSSFKGKVFYSIDIANDYSLKLLAVEIVDAMDCLVKRFEKFEYKSESEKKTSPQKTQKKDEPAKTVVPEAEKKTSPQKAQQSLRKDESSKTVSPEAKKEPSSQKAPSSKKDEPAKTVLPEKRTSLRDVNPQAKEESTKSFFNQVIVSFKNDFSTGFDFSNAAVNLQYLPFCMLLKNYSLKVGAGVSLNDQENITLLVKNGLYVDFFAKNCIEDYPPFVLDVVTGVIFKGSNLENVGYIVSAEIDFRLPNCFGLDIAYTPAEFSFQNNALNCNVKHWVSVGVTLTSQYIKRN